MYVTYVTFKWLYYLYDYVRIALYLIAHHVMYLSVDWGCFAIALINA